MVSTRSQDAKGALEHIASVVLVYNAKDIQAAFNVFEVHDVHDFMSIDNLTDFLKDSFNVEEINEDGSNYIRKVTLSSMTLKKLVLLQQWYASQDASDFTV